MTTKRVRTPIVCLCPDCHNGSYWQRTKHGVVAMKCPHCNGTGEVIRYVNEIVHVGEAQTGVQEASE